MQHFILKLELKDKDSLGAVRCTEGLMVAEDSSFIWIKGDNVLLNADFHLKQLPVKTTFLADDNNNLFIPGKLTPVEKLKALEWIPLSTFIQVEAPVAAFPGQTNEKVEIKLVVSKTERKGIALLTSLAIWKQWAESAPGIRLERLKFAVSEKKEVIVIGDPLPPIPGKEYWAIDDILLPSGFQFEFSFVSAFIAEKLNEDGRSLILFDSGGNWRTIDKAFFSNSNRSAVRLTTLNND